MRPGLGDQLAALLPIRERDLGPEHPSTLNTRSGSPTGPGRPTGAGASSRIFASILMVQQGRAVRWLGC
jgi:hypothetical protein